MELIKTLAIKNDFHYHKDRTQKVETIKLTRSEEVKWVQKAQITFKMCLFLEMVDQPRELL